MFSVVAALIFFGIAVVLFVASRFASKDNKGIVFGWGVVSVIVGVIWLLSATIGSYSNQLEDFSSVKQTKQEIKLFSERRESLVAVVRAELSKYPEYEKKILGDIRTEILLQFPVLKSNETIMETAKQIVKLEDDVYKLRSDLIKIQGCIYWREISPWVIYVTPYQRFFGELNPVALAK